MGKFHIVFLLSALAYTAIAAPALVWNSSSSSNSDPVYISDRTSSTDLFHRISDNLADDGLSLVFVLHRAKNGDENLSSLANAGAFPSLSGMTSSTIYTHVEGVEGGRSVLRDLQKTDKNAVLVDWSALEGKLAGSIPAVSGKKKKAARRKLEQANTVVVDVDVEGMVSAAELDAMVSNAIQRENVKSVVVTAARSAKEAKDAKMMKKMFAQRNRKVARNAPRRRLEQDQNNNNNNNNNNQYQDNNDEAVYYVYMTPNILAGLLFTFLFTFVTFLGISCMGMIQGQDVFVSKMPIVGREA